MSTPELHPLLSRIRMPGETFRLPSGGLFYEPGVLDESVVDGEIYVFPMTAVDEICLKTPDLLYSGNAVHQVFARCIPTVLQAGKLLAKDVDFLLICLRKVSYGEEMELSYTHECKEAKERKYKVSVQEFLKRSKKIDPSRFGSDFQLDLTNGQVVKMRPISYENFVTLLQANEPDGDPQHLADRLYGSVAKVIASVDEFTGQPDITLWLSKLPPSILIQVTGAIDKTTAWGPDGMVNIKCKDCGEEVQIEAPLNPLTFFT